MLDGQTLQLPEQNIPIHTPPAAYERGVASTYGEGDGFEGNLTACGQVFHTKMVQVAHKSLPCGTMIRVQDSDTGRSVVAEVTDRGPYIPGRIVDLSWGAFRQLEPSAPGLLNVTVYLLDG
jgi:rare lipoprotein A